MEATEVFFLIGLCYRLSLIALQRANNVGTKHSHMHSHSLDICIAL